MPRIEAALGQLFGEYPPVGCVTHRIYGGSTGNDVIGLVQGPPAPGLAEIVGDHNLGAVLADDPADHSAQGHAVLQNPVRQPQKLHDVDTDEFRRLDLLCLTHSAALIWGQAIDARLTAGDHRVTDGFARVGPPGHGRRRAELKIIRMRHDAQGGAPRLVDGCKIRHSVRLIRRTIGVPEVASGGHPVPEIALQTTRSGKPPSTLRSHTRSSSTDTRKTPPTPGRSATSAMSVMKVVSSSEASQVARSSHRHRVQ